MVPGSRKPVCKDKRGEGFTLLELLAVMFISSILVGILLPVVTNARRRARKILGVNNLRQITATTYCYTLDNDERYPPSVATIGRGRSWNWQEPFVLTNIRSRAPHVHRAMSGYLRSYIPNADIMYCPNAPRKYKYLQQAWDAGDNWNNPDSWYPRDWVKGTYCFYWNYVGLLENNRLFIGPQTSFGRRGQSKLLMSCYLGQGFYLSPDSYSSCEKIRGSFIIQERLATSSYWSRMDSDNFNLKTISTKFNCAYTDGRVESFSASQAVPMQVIKDRITLKPYRFGPGVFYLPKKALP